MRIRIKQVILNGGQGVSLRPGDTFSPPDHVAESWIDLGWAEAIPEEKPRREISGKRPKKLEKR